VKAFGGLLAIKEVNFTLSKGEILCIIGPNGAGKTTLLNLLTGVWPPSEGEIWFKGQKISGLAAHRSCSLGISRTFQNLQLFSDLSVIENVMAGCYTKVHSSLLEVMLRFGRARREEQKLFDKAMEKLSLLGLEKKSLAMPLSLPFREQKLVAMARALATEPEVLLLDEPAAGLSVEEMRNLGQLILKLNEQGLTILFIEHRMGIVENLSNRVIVLNFGCKIAEGTFAEVQRNEQVIAAYLGGS
jgi:branched-chain amino acid transport system ATP-binding protein